MRHRGDVLLTLFPQSLLCGEPESFFYTTDYIVKCVSAVLYWLKILFLRILGRVFGTGTNMGQVGICLWDLHVTDLG